MTAIERLGVISRHYQVRHDMPAHESVYRALRERIVFGELLYGEAMSVQALSAWLGTGVTPTREAVRRLSADGALIYLEDRRVCVPRVGRDALDELADLRKMVETELVTRATHYVTDEDVDALQQEDRLLNQALDRHDRRGYLEHNFRFHTQIYDLAHAPILEKVATNNWLQYGPALADSFDQIVKRRLVNAHQLVIDALAARDGAAARLGILRDVEQGFGVIHHAQEVIDLR